MADKLRTAQQLETLQSRYIGTGHADTTKAEWTSNIMRDSYASYVGHLPLLSYLSLGMGECRERVRMKFVEGVVRGAGQQKDTHVNGKMTNGVNGDHMVNGVNGASG
ncbi:hypothetical protein LTR50_003959 [Elasticomyces elasticus]|nr:hypothetical protein LTR50_003959 [Elasticomyces elasticus]